VRARAHARARIGDKNIYLNLYMKNVKVYWSIAFLES